MRTIFVITTCACAFLSGCGQDSPAENTDTAGEQTQAGKNYDWVDRLNKNPAKVNASTESESAWDSDMQRIAAAMPPEQMTQKPALGYWSKGNFSPTSGEVRALKASYTKTQTTLLDKDLTPIEESESSPSIKRNVDFEEFTDLVVIFGGSRLAEIRSAIVNELTSAQWGEGAMDFFGDAPKIVFWEKGGERIYLDEVDGMLLYARERNGAHTAGSGQGISYGAQKIGIFRIRYAQMK